jgi:uncharacterized protein GlcG (DUF336 family)
MIERARAHAERVGVPMNIAVVDGGGHLIAFARMDRAIRGSIEIALTKAKTSILFNGYLIILRPESAIRSISWRLDVLWRALTGGIA